MNETGGKMPSPRRSLLDLAPLELDCMNTLWPMGEGTVREIRDRLAERRPRAYTTIMTIMDRLARKGVVERRKIGRAYLYRPNLSAEQARAQALGQVVENFFGGSKEALLAQLGKNLPTAHFGETAAVPPARARAAVAAAAASAAENKILSPGMAGSPAPVVAPPVPLPSGEGADGQLGAAERIDDTLL
jgi:BlaI family penicillinase repressor